MQIAGAQAIENLKDGDTVLISEGCTHHRQCDDIGTVKMPRWIREYTGKDLHFAFTSGTEFPRIFRLMHWSCIVAAVPCLYRKCAIVSPMGTARRLRSPTTESRSPTFTVSCRA